MPRISYNCKFCGKPGSAEYDPDCPPLKLEIWKEWLACNRCSDFHNKRLRLERVIGRQCTNLTVMNNLRDEAFRAESDDDEKAREKIRSLLVDLTKAYASHVCRFYNKPTTWEPEFVTLLCEAPHKSGLVLRHYLKDMAGHQARTA